MPLFYSTTGQLLILYVLSKVQHSYFYTGIGYKSKTYKFQYCIHSQQFEALHLKHWSLKSYSFLLAWILVCVLKKYNTDLGTYQYTLSMCQHEVKKILLLIWVLVWILISFEVGYWPLYLSVLIWSRYWQIYLSVCLIQFLSV